MYRRMATIRVRLSRPKADYKELFVPSIFRRELEDGLGYGFGHGGMGLVEGVYVSIGSYDMIVDVWGEHERDVRTVSEAINGMRSNGKGGRRKAVEKTLVFNYC